MRFIDVEAGADGDRRGGVVVVVAGLRGRVCSLGWRGVMMSRLKGRLMLMLLLRLAGVVGGDDAKKVVNVICFITKEVSRSKHADKTGIRNGGQ